MLGVISSVREGLTLDVFCAAGRRRNWLSVAVKASPFDKASEAGYVREVEPSLLAGMDCFLGWEFGDF